MAEMDNSSEPTSEELSLLTQLGRLERMITEEGISPAAAAERLLAPETVEAYSARNRAAMEALELRLLSPEYMARFAAAQVEPDPIKRAAAHAALKRENFSAIDMEAVHRVITARNRQMRAEGQLPPEAPI